MHLCELNISVMKRCSTQQGAFIINDYLRNLHFKHKMNSALNITIQRIRIQQKPMRNFLPSLMEDFQIFSISEHIINKSIEQKKSPDSILTMCMMIELLSFNIGIMLICRFDTNNNNHPCKFTLSSSLTSILFIRQISGLLSLYLQNQP